MRGTLAERFAAKIGTPDANGCIAWLGARDRWGYGRIRNEPHRGGWSVAHRAALELKEGPIPAGFVVDHLCRNPNCVNPDHLEAVTNAENVKRGLVGEQQRTGRCKRGHDLAVDGYWRNHLHVRCRACRREDRAQKRREAAA